MPKITKQQAIRKGKRIGDSARSRESVKPVLDRIQPIGFDEDEGITLLLYGKSGTGKTTLWGTFPKNILAIVCSGGKRKKPGELRSIDTPENKGKIHQVTLHESTEIDEIIKHQARKGTYATIVLDHVSGFQDLILKEIIGKDIPEQKGWGIAKRQDWGTCSFQMKEHLIKLLSLSCNVVLVAHERELKGSNEENDEVTSNDEDLSIKPFVAAAVTPTMINWLNGAVDYLGQTYIRPRETTKIIERKVKGKIKTKEIRVRVKGKYDHCLRTGKSDMYATKFRVPRKEDLPNEIVDPNYDKIMQLIRGEREEG